MDVATWARFLDTLDTFTTFQSIDIDYVIGLYDRYRCFNIAGYCEMYVLTYDEFKFVFRRLGDKHIDVLFQRLVKSVATGGREVMGLPPSRKIDVYEVLALLAATCRGALEAKCALLFNLSNLDGEGELSEDELCLIISSVSSALAKFRLAEMPTEEEVEYIASLPFTDDEGYTRLYMTCEDFNTWVKTYHHPLQLLEQLALIPRLRRVLATA